MPGRCRPGSTSIQRRHPPARRAADPQPQRDAQPRSATLARSSSASASRCSRRPRHRRAQRDRTSPSAGIARPRAERSLGTSATAAARTTTSYGYNNGATVRPRPRRPRRPLRGRSRHAPRLSELSTKRRKGRRSGAIRRAFSFCGPLAIGAPRRPGGRLAPTQLEGALPTMAITPLMPVYPRSPVRPGARRGRLSLWRAGREISRFREPASRSICSATAIRI